VDRNWARDIPRLYPNVKPRTAMSAAYNCHGLVFASRRTHIISALELNKVLRDDDYKEIDMTEAVAVGTIDT
jgi:hypothetical protein